MAHIVIITHAHDDFVGQNYLLRYLVDIWVREGNHVSIVSGTDQWPDADIAIMHVDLSVLPAAYLEAKKRYQFVINGSAADIRKKFVSRHLVSKGDGWDGPVIVKTDLNSGGIPELRIGYAAKRKGTSVEFSAAELVCTQNPYPVLANSRLVSQAVWDNKGLVVERFLPERDAHGFWIRVWIFLGDRERCTRLLGDHPVIKSGNILAHDPAPVPEQLRAERQRLGFDYGKFDFAVHDGQPVLFDANRTPGAPPALMQAQLDESNAKLARGIEAWLKK